MPASPQETPHGISSPHHVWASASPSFNPSNDLGSSFSRDPGDPSRAAQGTFQYTPALGAHLCVHFWQFKLRAQCRQLPRLPSQSCLIQRHVAASVCDLSGGYPRVTRPMQTMKTQPYQPHHQSQPGTGAKTKAQVLSAPWPEQE